MGSVLAASPRRGVEVGCSTGADALVLSTALALGASSRLQVFAAFGPISPPWPAARVFAPGASSSVSSVSGVASAHSAGAAVSWWAGGGLAVPLAGRLASRSAALVVRLYMPGEEGESFGDAPVVIVSEFANKPGTSVTNAIEQIAAEVIDAVTPTRVPIFVEHYSLESTGGGEETFDPVVFAY